MHLYKYINTCAKVYIYILKPIYLYNRCLADDILCVRVFVHVLAYVYVCTRSALQSMYMWDNGWGAGDTTEDFWSDKIQNGKDIDGKVVNKVCSALQAIWLHAGVFIVLVTLSHINVRTQTPTHKPTCVHTHTLSPFRTRAHTYTHTRARAHTHTNIPTHKHVRAHTLAHTHTHTHALTHTSTHTHTHTCTCTHTHT